jgi:HEPN domain-containing protein
MLQVRTQPVYNTIMTSTNLAKQILDSADEKRDIALHLFDSKYYTFALFTWHLAIEKVLKALITQQRKEYEFTHNLRKLALNAGVEPNEQELDELREITDFNIEARYEEYKSQFHKKADQLYTESWNGTCTRLYQKYRDLYEQRSNS